MPTASCEDDTLGEALELPDRVAVSDVENVRELLLDRVTERDALIVALGLMVGVATKTQRPRPDALRKQDCGMVATVVAALHDAPRLLPESVTEVEERLGANNPAGSSERPAVPRLTSVSAELLRSAHGMRLDSELSGLLARYSDVRVRAREKSSCGREEIWLLLRSMLVNAGRLSNTPSGSVCSAPPKAMICDSCDSPAKSDALNVVMDCWSIHRTERGQPEAGKI